MSVLAGKMGAIYNNYASTDKSKLIADFQDDETWTSNVGTQTDDPTNYRLGTESIKITSTGDVFLHSNRDSYSINLDLFESGASSDDTSYIYAIFYVSNSSKVASVFVGFDADATYAGTNVYTYTITTIAEGWNYVKIKKSAFNGVGSPDWASVDAMRVGWTGQATSTGEYVSFQCLYLVDASYDLVLSQNTAYTMENIGLFYNWGVNIDAGLVEATTFDSEGWGQTAQTIKKFTVTNEKYWANSDYLSDFGSNLVLLLYLSTSSGYRYEGTAKLSTDSVDLTVDELITESLDFMGQGELYSTTLQTLDS